MTNSTKPPRDTGNGHFAHEVRAQETRKLVAKKEDPSNVWSGFAMFGLVGWSIVLPTLLGAALGWWLDKDYPGQRSWTLVFLVSGLVLGCANAWRWMDQQHKKLTMKDKHE